MRLTLYIGITMTAIGLNTYTADSATVIDPTPEKEPAPLHSRPFAVKCAAAVNVWIEVDGSSLPPRIGAKAESRKRVQLKLVGSAPSRGESVVCSYASRGRDVTTAYYVRCIQPRKERGQRHLYQCR